MIKFTEQQELLRKVVREFVEKEIAPIADKIDEDTTYSVELMRKIGQMGFSGVFIPSQYGGAGLGPIEQAIILEEIGRQSASIATTLNTNYAGIAAIVYNGTEEQKKKYLPDLCSGKKFSNMAITEPAGGSDFMGQQATGRLIDGQWVLNGRKCFISNTDNADITFVTVRTGEDAKGRAQITGFLVEAGTEGFGLGRKESKFGLRGAILGDLNFNDVRVGADAVIGKVGEGAKLALGYLGQVGRGGAAAVGLGIMRACLEESVKFAKERTIYGRPLSKLTNIQFIIAQNRTDYEAARLLTYHAMGISDAGLSCAAEMAMAKFFVAEGAVNAAKRTMDLMGGYGVINDYPVGRYLRDAVTSIPASGTSHIMQVIIAGQTLA